MGVSSSRFIIDSLPPTLSNPNSKKVNDWDSEEVNFFLDLIPLIGNDKYPTTALKKHASLFRLCTGATLCAIHEDPTSISHSMNEEDRYTIFCYLRELFTLHNGVLDQEKFTIVSKLLSTKPEISSNMVDRYKALKNIKENLPDKDMLFDIANALLSRKDYFSFTQLSTIQTVNDSVFAHEDILQKHQIDEEALSIKESYNLNTKQGFRVKLILNPILPSKGLFDRLKAKTIHSLAGGLLRNKLYTPYGTFHASLLVGPYLMEFNDSGIVLPRKFKKDDALFMLDVIPPISYSSDEEKAQKLSKIEDVIFEVAKHFNTTIRYHNRPGISTKFANCQSFVDYLLEKIIGSFSIDKSQNLLYDEGCIKKCLFFFAESISCEQFHRIFHFG